MGLKNRKLTLRRVSAKVILRNCRDIICSGLFLGSGVRILNFEATYTAVSGAN
jgi:hypothetical protein